ncbi:hypothetical protein AF332_20340 [Sporosarcina globispora]|uniref:DUF3862 domain-containing protein n=1 Tax=Sporosarcina globispora TaxID=1459 RepID=A0A0M0GHF2_SPOGL|nr:hypothetical protein [Sporosarcina globispora]KON88912.1 hypothetical protein AF332_20340 [Sporosarcina globispora]
MFYLFVGLFIITIALGILTIFFLFKWEKYGSKRLSITALALVVSVLILIPLGKAPVVDEMSEEEANQWYEDNIAPKSTEETASVAQEVKENKPTISKAEADQIHVGMTYEEVVSIIGQEGTLDNETKMSHTTLTSYKWKNEDGSYAAIFFSDKNTGVPKVKDFIFSNLK